MKYIDSDKLIAEIGRRKKSIDECPFIEAEFGAEMRREGKIQAYNEILSLITSLQQEQPEGGCSEKPNNLLREHPEVDLEKEIKRFLSNSTKMNKGEWRGKYPISDIGFRAVARHFWNKGYNARKGE